MKDRLQSAEAITLPQSLERVFSNLRTEILRDGKMYPLYAILDKMFEQAMGSSTYTVGGFIRYDIKYV